MYATGLVNFLSVIITARMRNDIVKKKLNEKHSYKQILRMLSKYKKARAQEGSQWRNITMLKYIELTKTLDV